MAQLDFTDLPIVDVHLHPPLRAAATPGEPDFRRLFTESDFPEQLPHVETTMVFRRAVAELARLLDTDPEDWRSVVAARHALGFAGWYLRCLEAGGIRGLLVDYGFSTGEQLNHGELSALARRAETRVHPVFRLETWLGSALVHAASLGDLVERLRHEIDERRARGTVALKSIIAYRCGLAVAPPSTGEAEAAFRAARERAQAGDERIAAKPLLDHCLLAALDKAAETGLPLHLHTGFGDRDLFLPDVDPVRLRHVLENPRYRNVPIVLLHCYPFIRQGAYLAHVYPNVYVDLSLGVPLVGSRVGALYAEALELAPTSKILYGSDAFSTPDLMLLSAIWTRRALAGLFTGWVDRGDMSGRQALAAARAIFADNTLSVHGRTPE